jgi:hypothetical protein
MDGDYVSDLRHLVVSKISTQSNFGATTMSITPPDGEVKKAAPTEPKLDPLDPLPPIVSPASLPPNIPQVPHKPHKESEPMDGCLLAFFILLGAFLLLFGTCFLAVRF